MLEMDTYSSYPSSLDNIMDNKLSPGSLIEHSPDYSSIYNTSSESPNIFPFLDQAVKYGHLHSEMEIPNILKAPIAPYAVTIKEEPLDDFKPHITTIENVSNLDCTWFVGTDQEGSLYDDLSPEDQNIDRVLRFGCHHVSLTSKTPYTDATQCKKKTNHVKRPMNAFMVWSKFERYKICQENPTMHNADISKNLGLKWKEMSLGKQSPFMREAERLKMFHKIEFPDYKYKPKKKTSGKIDKLKNIRLARNNRGGRGRNPSGTTTYRRRRSSRNTPSEVSENDATSTTDVSFYEDASSVSSPVDILTEITSSNYSTPQSSTNELIDPSSNSYDLDLENFSNGFDSSNPSDVLWDDSAYSIHPLLPDLPLDIPASLFSETVRCYNI